MAIIKLNPFIEEIHGKFGDAVFRRGPNGKIILSKAPQKKKKNSQKAQKKQKERNSRQQQHMLAAHDFAHAAMQDPEMKAHYEQKAIKQKSKPYLMALSAYLKGRRIFGE